MEEKETKRSTSRLILQFLALGLVLVIFPAGSYYYLQKGMNYRKALMNELKEVGQLEDYMFEAEDSIKSFRSLKGKLKLAGFVEDFGPDQTALLGSTLMQLHDQFNEREDVVFLLHYPESNGSKRNEFEIQYELNDPDQCIWIPMEKSVFENTRRVNYRLNDEIYRKDRGNTLVLADTSGMIRRYYHPEDANERKLLVEHLAVLLPRPQEKELIFKRENEK